MGPIGKTAAIVGGSMVAALVIVPLVPSMGDGENTVLERVFGGAVSAAIAYGVTRNPGRAALIGGVTIASALLSERMPPGAALAAVAAQLAAIYFIVK